MPSSSGKEIEETENAHVICLLYKLISSSRHSDDLSIALHRSFEARERQLSITQKTKGNYHVRIFCKMFFVSQDIKIIILTIWVIK